MCRFRSRRAGRLPVKQPDILLDHDVGRAADQDEMLDIIAAHQDEPAPVVHGCGIHHRKPRHAVASAGNERTTAETPYDREENDHREQDKGEEKDETDDGRRRLADEARQPRINHYNPPRAPSGTVFCMGRPDRRQRVDAASRRRKPLARLETSGPVPARVPHMKDARAAFFSHHAPGWGFRRPQDMIQRSRSRVRCVPGFPP